jgi:hypothetical protein
MRFGILPACALLGAIFALPEAKAAVLINIDLSTQTMHVRSESGSYDWRISTARSGYRTPRGVFHAQGLQRMHYSSKYDLSPMPHSIFFAGGYAIHGTYETRSLGRPVSHGCVRLAPGNAAVLFHMVQREGARIIITGAPVYYARFRRLKYPAAYARLRRRPSHYALWQRRHHGPLAYAPARRAPAPVKAWQTNPVVRSVPLWPAWP